MRPGMVIFIAADTPILQYLPTKTENKLYQKITTLCKKNATVFMA